ncbi:type IV pilus assembly protein PilW [Thioalkalivibrio sp. K90mix]|uniref:PilW family protein n=1 Tax=Thioalkalivibrio sp. (strain K90mix) TaxID=396595 RepID=UPI000195A389|nr:PilW family protein [Thioalkalivibrio sp. K90mix]ADC70727.1 type IV pilus assembly protein PilW [Thioalkalivibrio sp. K90mix]
MSTARSFASIRQRIRGFTLVELMVAMVLGLLIVGGVIALFVSTQQTSRTQEAMSRAQETGRFVIERIARDAREAGHQGCRGGNINNLLDTASADYDPWVHGVESAFLPPEQPNDHLRGDVLTLHGMTAIGSIPVSVPNTTAPINTDETVDVAQGEVVLVADQAGTTCELFQNAPAQPGVLSRATGANISPGNVAGDLTDFSGPATISVSRLETITYYIAESSASPGVASLFRRSTADTDSSGNPVRREIAEGVYDLRLEFGQDTNDNQQIDRFVAASNTASWSDSDWAQVAAVRVHLLVYNGLDNNVVDQPRTGLLFANELFDAPDRRLYLVFTTTVATRNRLE